MMIALNVLMGLVTGVLFLGVIGEENEKQKRSLAIAFAAALLFIVALNTIM